MYGLEWGNFKLKMRVFCGSKCDFVCLSSFWGRDLKDAKKGAFQKGNQISCCVKKS